MATVFMEPSTRTRLSFHYAMEKLGGKTVEFGSPKVSSTDKGESFEDTIRIIDGYGTDLIVVRHPSEGASKLAAEVADAKVINAGDGSREHPTQTLLDLYEIAKANMSRTEGMLTKILGGLNSDQVIPVLTAIAKDPNVRLGIRNKAVQILGKKSPEDVATAFAAPPVPSTSTVFLVMSPNCNSKDLIAASPSVFVPFNSPSLFL